jgi:hypothetical protein
MVRLRRVGTVVDSEKDIRSFWMEEDGWIENRWITRNLYTGYLILYSTSLATVAKSARKCVRKYVLINILRIKSYLGSIHIGKPVEKPAKTR